MEIPWKLDILLRFRLDISDVMKSTVSFGNVEETGRFERETKGFSNET